MKYRVLEFPTKRCIFETKSEDEAKKYAKDIIFKGTNILSTYYGIEEILEVEDNIIEKTFIENKANNLSNESISEFNKSLYDVCKAIKALFETI